MKNYRQRKKRSKARKRDREKGIWKYMGMNHVCPNSTSPYKRLYYVFDDISKMYISDPFNRGNWTKQQVTDSGMQIEVVDTIHAARKFENFLADHMIKQIKQLKGNGAWRAIRVK